ncbi:gluconokinase [Marinimicrobium locisalis]|uniref:gluconokinase n=1 Tax=Marinimicrobium locisalis TaxID=546022 RepID=UPI003221CA9C
MSKLFILMGVSGAGKSTVAAALAEHFGYRYLDADNFHSDSAKAHMAAGHPLTDEMRVPWIERLCAHLKERAARGEDCVLAFSGLKRRHREPLRHCNMDTHFLFLDGDADTIAQRMSSREGHFMPPSLLESQLSALERPSADEPDIVPIDIQPPVSQVLERVYRAVGAIEEAH